MIGKVSMKCTRETFSEKQLQFLPYSLCTLEYSNSSTQRACLENLQVECSDVGGRVGMRKREKKNPVFQGVPAVPLLRKPNEVTV